MKHAIDSMFGLVLAVVFGFGCHSSSNTTSMGAVTMLVVTPPATIPTTTVDAAWENVGSKLSSKAYRMMPIVGEATNGWRQLFWWRDRPSLSGAKTLYIRSLDMTPGVGMVTAALDLPNTHEVWSTLLVDNDTAYLGLNSPAGLVVYDRARNTFTSLGAPFVNLFSSIGSYSLAASTDGKILVGAIGREVSIWDPVALTWTRYGDLETAASGYSYVYYVTGEADWTYAALRGTAPWKVKAINRTTAAMTDIYQVPDTNHTIVGMYKNCLEVRIVSTLASEFYQLHGGTATRVTVSCKAAGVPRTVPTVQVDDTQDNLLTFYWQMPGTTTWLNNGVTIGGDPVVVSRLMAWDTDTVLGSSSLYGPFFKYELADSSFIDQGTLLTNVDAYAMTRVGNLAYIGGYPSAIILSENPYSLFTSNASFPGKPGVPDTDPGANPRRVAYVANTLNLGTQDIVGEFQGDDGKLWATAIAFRYQDAFYLISYNPVTGAFAKWDDAGAFYGLELSWTAGNKYTKNRQILMATRVATPPLAGGPSAALLYIFDTERGVMLRKQIPFPDVTTLGATIFVDAEHVLGFAYNAAFTQTTIYTMDMYCGTITNSKVYNGILGTKPETSGAPRKGNDLAQAPDGSVWSSTKQNSVVPGSGGQYYQQLIKIDPVSLVVTAVGRIDVNSSFTPLLWMGKDLYFGGAEHLRRLRNAVP